MCVLPRFGFVYDRNKDIGVAVIVLTLKRRMRSEFHQIFISSSVFTLNWVRFCNLIKRRSDLTLPAPQLIQEVFLTQEQKKKKKKPTECIKLSHRSY